MTGKLILVTTKHLARNEQVNVRRSLNQLKYVSLTILTVSEISFVRSRYYTERLFLRVNHKNELYFSMISFQNKANRVYESEINIVVFKLRN